MSSQPVRFSQTPGPIGERASEHGISQAVTIPAFARTAITSPQLGRDLETGELITATPNAKDQIGAAFECADAALKSAGVKDGISAAHKVVAYLADLKLEPLMMEVWRDRYPFIRPIWANIAVSGFLVEGQIVGIQAEAAIL